MGYEIELKARVADWDGMESILRSHCEFIRRFRKSDRYFSNTPGTERETLFRLREEDDRVVVTFKTKDIRDGVEFNREVEFGITDPAAFVELAGRIGCVQYAGKVKAGLEFRSGDITVELVKVEPIGAFVEAEILDDSEDPAFHARAAERLKQLLTDIGISDDQIESRPYVALLSGNQVGQDFAGNE